MNTTTHPWKGWLTWLSQGAMTFLALALLAGVGWWGHHSGWKLPTFSSIKGETDPETEAWCDAHGVPADICVGCKPELGPQQKDYGWCAEHGVFQCTIDHPELAQMPNTPIVATEDRQRVKQGLETRPRPTNDEFSTLYQRLIQFTSQDAMDEAGVDVAMVENRPILETVHAPAEIVYDPTRLARLSARAPGTVWLAQKQVGDPVASGEVIAIVDAVRVGDAKAKLLQDLAQVTLAQATLDRLTKLRGDVVSEAQVLEAEASLKQARAVLLGSRQTLVNLGLPLELQEVEGLTEAELTKKLQFLGLPDSIIRGLDPDTTTSNLIPVKAPFAGIVSQRNVVEGEVVDTATPLYVIVDTSQMWLNINVRQEDVQYVAIGKKVLFDKETGTIDWISSSADPMTRSVEARAVLQNPDGKLRASTFGEARIVLREEANVPMVPSQALEWDGSSHIVFVRDKHFFEDQAPKLFHTRTVRPGVTQEGWTEIIVGVLPGEVVATDGSGVLRAELLKNDIGAG